MKKKKKFKIPTKIIACTKPHLTGEALIAHIKAFDSSRCLRPGNLYLINDKEVRI